MSQKSAIPYSIHGDTGKAPEGQEWDATAAQKALQSWAGVDADEPTDAAWTKYRQGFTWYASEEPKLLGSYKLPHHTVSDGRLVVVWQGVAGAMGALMGARGGVDIPDGDRRGVYNHLASHYRQFDKEPPEFREASAAAPATRKIMGVEVKVISDQERILRFVGSDESEDRDGDIIVQDGWDLSVFRKHGVMQWAHDYRVPAIGRGISADVKEKRLHVEIRFAGIEQRHEMADLVYRLYKDDFLTSTSVGFLPRKWEEIPKDEDNPRPWTGTKFLEQELLELSAVNVPANANAVIVAAAKGAFDASTREGLIKHGFLPVDRVVLLTDLATAFTRSLAEEMRKAFKVSDSGHGSPRGPSAKKSKGAGPGPADVTAEDVRKIIREYVNP